VFVHPDMPSLMIHQTEDPDDHIKEEPVPPLKGLKDFELPPLLTVYLFPHSSITACRRKISALHVYFTYAIVWFAASNRFLISSNIRYCHDSSLLFYYILKRIIITRK